MLLKILAGLFFSAFLLSITLIIPRGTSLSKCSLVKERQTESNHLFIYKLLAFARETVRV